MITPIAVALPLAGFAEKAVGEKNVEFWKFTEY